MGVIRLDVQSPRNVHGIEIGFDPEPNWSLNDILQELNLLESKFISSPLVLRPLDQSSPSLRVNSQEKRKNAFIVRVSDEDLDYFDSDEETHTPDCKLIPSNQYTHRNIYHSGSDSVKEPRLQIQAPTPEKMGVVEGALLEMSHEYNLYVKEEVRNHISMLETELLAGKEKSASALDQLERVTQARRDMDRKLDMHYQRKTAEALDDHLTAVQRDHEHKSQKVEREISDAAAEEAKRKEKVLQEERLRQQKAKAAEEAKLEAERRAEDARKTEEARKADEARRANEAKIAGLDAERRATEKEASLAAQKKLQSPGSIVRAAESALNMEAARLKIFKELDEKNQILISSAGKDYVKYKREIARHVKTIRGTIDNVRTKANELVRMLNNPACPQSVTAMILAQEVISICEAPNGDSFVFACGHVIVLVSAQVPLVMDLLLTEFHRACIYTVPKHIMYSEATFQTKEAYYKSIGYREEDGELETTEDYLKRMQSYMKLYAALVQTEVQGIRNLHGIEEGWRWLARFLNALPANRYTLVALEAFLSMAGFALHGKYKSQFQKLLATISRDFLAKVKGRGDSQDNSLVIFNLDSQKFLQEPEGRRMHGALLSSSLVPEEGYQQHGYHNSYGGYY